ncbi:zinc ribbon domain-containing protein [Streptomyces sp. NPDC012403]|uniref:zinc ribbon domain-containing protein n=1 Tax=Streptomyces sp. NPDC012403 TaxID=3364831 RepID=UPI0036E1E5BE
MSRRGPGGRSGPADRPRRLEQPATRVWRKAGLNQAILAQGWGLLRRRTGEKAPGRVEDVPVPYTSLRCSARGRLEKDSRKSQAKSVRATCGYACDADENAAVDVAAGQRGIPRPRRHAPLRRPRPRGSHSARGLRPRRPPPARRHRPTPRPCPGRPDQRDPPSRRAVNRPAPRLPVIPRPAVPLSH